MTKLLQVPIGLLYDDGHSQKHCTDTLFIIVRLNCGWRLQKMSQMICFLDYF